MNYLAAIANEAGRIGEVARAGPLDARVPHIPRWKMSDVLAHLGGIHRWAGDIVLHRSMDQGRRRGKETGEALIVWFEEGAARLLEILGDADPDETCPNFSPGSPNTVAFWHRRQAHETTMHRWDMEAAVPDLTSIPAEFAADGVDELFHSFTRSRGKQVLAQPIRFSTGDRRWTLAPTDQPGRVDLVDTDADVAVTGSAEDLLLALWKRKPIDESGLVITGSRPVAIDFIAGPLSP
jgi:uncharacterized protein (TIGR03083 family)